MFTVWCSIIVAIVLLLIDQATKLIVAQYMTVGDSYTVVDGFFRIEYVQNHGAAFGMLQNFRYVFIILTLSIVVLALFYLLRGKIKNKYLIWSISLIVSGGVGNLIDRIFNTGGYVVDFFAFDLSWFPYVFNVADICVTIGGIILVLYYVVDIIKGFKTKETSSENAQSDNE